ncbi:MAG TPA: GC-type dockerin domain-anchored protein [Phycisphaerales bacterium]|nr:GC-type dockerin domain-anchored protein [Phycisphaerales bacterium]HMP37237.1 GC-type dockerin domain-anchored protein [Phycisphaerales bacterium]
MRTNTLLAPSISSALILAVVVSTGAGAGVPTVIGQPITMELGSANGSPFGPGYAVNNFPGGAPAIVGPELIAADAIEFPSFGPIPVQTDIADATISQQFGSSISFSSSFEFTGFVFRFENLPDRAIVVTGARVLDQSEITPPVDTVHVLGNSLAIDFYGRLLFDGATLTVGYTYTVVELTPGDLNGDGIVDGADLGLLLSAWGSENFAADLNGDGVVDGADLGLLLAAWGG